MPRKRASRRYISHPTHKPVDAAKSANPATTNLETFLAIAQEIALADMLLARLTLARTTITDLRNYVEGELFRIKLLGTESDYSTHLANKLLDIDTVLKDITL